MNEAAVILIVYFGVQLIALFIQRIGHHSNKKWADDMEFEFYAYWPFILIAGIIYLFCKYGVGYIIIKPLDYIAKTLSKLF